MDRYGACGDQYGTLYMTIIGYAGTNMGPVADQYWPRGDQYVACS